MPHSRTTWCKSRLRIVCGSVEAEYSEHMIPVRSGTLVLCVCRAACSMRSMQEMPPMLLGAACMASVPQLKRSSCNGVESAASCCNTASGRIMDGNKGVDVILLSQRSATTCSRDTVVAARDATEVTALMDRHGLDDAAIGADATCQHVAYISDDATGEEEDAATIRHEKARRLYRSRATPSWSQTVSHLVSHVRQDVFKSACFCAGYRWGRWNETGSQAPSLPRTTKASTLDVSSP